MNIVDRIASLAMRVAPGRFTVCPDGLGNGDLQRLVAGGDLDRGSREAG